MEDLESDSLDMLEIFGVDFSVAENQQNLFVFS